MYMFPALGNQSFCCLLLGVSQVSSPRPKSRVSPGVHFSNAIFYCIYVWASWGRTFGADLSHFVWDFKTVLPYLVTWWFCCRICAVKARNQTEELFPVFVWGGFHHCHAPIGGPFIRRLGSILSSLTHKSKKMRPIFHKSQSVTKMPFFRQI